MYEMHNSRRQTMSEKTIDQSSCNCRKVSLYGYHSLSPAYAAEFSVNAAAVDQRWTILYVTGSETLDLESNASL